MGVGVFVFGEGRPECPWAYQKNQGSVPRTNPATYSVGGFFLERGPGPVLLETFTFLCILLKLTIASVTYENNILLSMS